MKYRILSLLLLGTCLWAAYASDAADRKPTKCPLGHNKLKQVPIAYGLRAFGETQQKQLDDLEIWPGGCIAGDEQEKTVCPQCRHYFEPHFGYWSKDVRDPKLLPVKADAFIAAWPVRETETAGGWFSQHVREGNVCGEMFSCWYDLSEAATDELVQKHLQNSAFPFERTDRTTAGRHYIYYRAFEHEHYYLVEIMRESGMDKTYVRADRSLEKPPYY